MLAPLLPLPFLRLPFGPTFLRVPLVLEKKNSAAVKETRTNQVRSKHRFVGIRSRLERTRTKNMKEGGI